MTLHYKVEELPKGQTDWEAVRNLTDDELMENALGDPDNPPLPKSFFENAHLAVRGLHPPQWVDTIPSHETESPFSMYDLPPDLADDFPTRESVISALRLVRQLRQSHAAVSLVNP